MLISHDGSTSTGSQDFGVKAVRRPEAKYE